MRTIGIIGGMSWESTVSYYQEINREIKKRLGGLHSAECIIYSVDFAEIERYQSEGRWSESGERLAEVTKKLESAGAELIMLATNTMHKVIDYVEEITDLPVIHIADATAEKMKEDRVHSTALLGTKYTMEQGFYKDRVRKYSIDVVVPNEEEQKRVNDIIFNELVLGELNQQSKQYYLQVIERLQQKGADSVILGCTEIGLLINQTDLDIPVYDTSKIHVQKAVDYALGSINVN
ncbi:aspartate/glutamate racemase family protein [Alkalibacillus haloalkaliphilus]|uniref:aspartate/glutamate racemase family protein n=1 Tax=Alkalibacillus haloalkaliphilus TaxID=94136 RepID=UPI0029357E7E|nr:aspartate/glutamate racemase family protein [Alkalibacillus haloalkaliphilus]MDV2583099.1 aspartate/glutamate racemase family protein [Alkalibacillus haloalkaliphilus]